MLAKFTVYGAKIIWFLAREHTFVAIFVQLTIGLKIPHLGAAQNSIILDIMNLLQNEIF